MLRTPPADPLARRDPVAIAAFLELFGPVIDAWFAPEVTGAENVPEGASLIVGSHNGGIMTPDMWILMLAGWRRFGPERPSYGLAHDQVMRVPVVARAVGLLGGVPARHDHASTLLERGAQVLVYPGGDVDTFRPWSERHKVKFGGRTGFVRLALRQQVPIVPVVSVGAHETFRVLTDGHRLAHALHLKELLRLEVLPVFLCLPWGIAIGPYELHAPLPSKIRIRVLPQIRFDLPPAAADDAATVRALAERVRGTMQAALDDLARVRDYGVRARLGELVQTVRHARRARDGGDVSSRAASVTTQDRAVTRAMPEGAREVGAATAIPTSAP
jgi:1-acyl-sn-glycerol-3-phosphate acyltransferase